MKKKFMLGVMLVLIGCGIWSVSAYDVWNPVQFVKQLFVTPNGESDSSKATIKLDGKTGRIDAKSVYVNWKSVVTTDYLGKIMSSLKIKYPVCSKWEALTSTDWRKLHCIKVELAKIDWRCNTSVKNGCYAGSSYGGRQSWDRYYWYCRGENGWRTASCSKYSPVPVDWRCNNSVKNECYAGSSYGGRQSWNRYYWYCRGENGWRTASCSKYSYQKQWHYKSAGLVCSSYDWKKKRIIDLYKKLFWRCPEPSWLNFWANEVTRNTRDHKAYDWNWLESAMINAGNIPDNRRSNVKKDDPTGKTFGYKQCWYGRYYIKKTNRCWRLY